MLGPAELCFGPSANNFGHTGILEMRESEAELKQIPPAGDHRTFTAMMLAKRTVTVKVPGLLRTWPAAAGPEGPTAGPSGPSRGVPAGHGALRPAGGAKSAVDRRARGGGLPGSGPRAGSQRTRVGPAWWPPAIISPWLETRESQSRQRCIKTKLAPSNERYRALAY